MPALYNKMFTVWISRSLWALWDNGTPSCQSMCPMRPTHRDRDDRSWPLAFPQQSLVSAIRAMPKHVKRVVWRTAWNPKQPFINGCFNWMIPNLYIENRCFTKHPFINGCLRFQGDIYFGILKGKSSLGGAWHVRCDSLIIYWSETLNSSESQCRFAQLHSYSWHPECRQVSNGLQFRVGFKPAAFLFLPFYINEDLSCLFWELFVQIGTEFQVSPGGHWRICAMQRKTWRPMISHSFAPHFHHHHHHHQTLLLTSNPPIHPWSTHSPWNLLLFCRQDWCACDHRVCDCQQILASQGFAAPPDVAQMGGWQQLRWRSAQVPRFYPVSPKDRTMWINPKLLLQVNEWCWHLLCSVVSCSAALQE